MPEFNSQSWQDYYSLFTVNPHNLDFHLDLIMEKLENTGNIEISPLCDNNGKISPLLGPLMKTLQDLGLNIEISQLSAQMASLPEFNKIYRAVKRVFRQAKVTIS